MELASSVLGFIASVLLFVPGWRASQYLRLISQVKETAEQARQAGSFNDPGAALAARLEQQSASWSRRDHYLLISGFSFLGASFLLAVLANT